MSNTSVEKNNNKRGDKGGKLLKKIDNETETESSDAESSSY